MLFFITGASGSGKSACIPGLRDQLNDYVVHDFDEVEVPADADTLWRQRTTEYWISRAIENQHKGKDTVICGGAVYGEILASPSITLIDRFAACLLDCADALRIKRVRGRGNDINMDMLCWSAWLRVHAVDPTWSPEVITKGGYDLMKWERWSHWQEGDIRWRQPVIDTTGRKLTEINADLIRWIHHETASEYPPPLGSQEADSPEDRLSQDG